MFYFLQSFYELPPARRIRRGGAYPYPNQFCTPSVYIVWKVHFDGVKTAFRQTKIDEKFVQIVDHIFKVMDNRAKVQREEAVPESEFAQAGYSFTL